MIDMVKLANSLISSDISHVKSRKVKEKLKFGNY